MARPTPTETDPVTVGWIESAETVDPTALLENADGIELEQFRSAGAVPDGELDVDCLACGVTGPDGDERLSGLESVREQRPTLPVVVVADDVDSEPLDEVLGEPWIDVVAADRPALAERLAHRIHAVVAHRRTERHAGQAQAALDAARDGLAVVADDGTVSLANRHFARQFGTDPEEVAGRPWQSLFAADAVERIDTEGLAAVADGWEWLGTCEGRRLDGTPVRLQVRLGTVETGAFVLAVSRPRTNSTDPTG